MAQIWDLWFPGAAAQGLSFARGRLEPAARLWVHAAPDSLDVTVRDDASVVIAAGKGLARERDCPMTLLTIGDRKVAREDRWPREDDFGTPVILPGGEVGILLSWWNAQDGSEWRWQVEFYNHR